jgi:hypothetical protein
MSVAITFFYAWKQKIGSGANLGSDTFKMMLTDATPNVSTWAAKGDCTQIASGNGYTTDGNSCALTSWTQTGGTSKLILGSPTAWTGGPSDMAQFRYCVLYDVTTGDLIGYYDYGSEVVLHSGDTFTATLDGTNGVLQLS